jgi:hypothetical protein
METVRSHDQSESWIGPTDLDLDLKNLRDYILTSDNLSEPIICNGKNYCVYKTFAYFADNNYYDVVDYMISNRNLFNHQYFDCDKKLCRKYALIFSKLYKNNNHEMLFHLLQKFYKIETRHAIVNILISHAIKYNDVEIIQKCIDSQIDIFNLGTDLFYQVCIQACQHDDYLIFHLFREKNLLDIGYPPIGNIIRYDSNEKKIWYNSMIFECEDKCSASAYDLFKLLTDNKIGNPEVGLKNIIWRHLMTNMENEIAIDIIKIFIDLGVNISAISDEINNLISTPSSKCVVPSIEVIELLIQNGFKINDERELLLRFIFNKNINAIEKLDLDLKLLTTHDIYEITQLELIHRTNCSMLDYLMEHGIDFSVINNITFTSDKINMIQKLQTNGVNTDQLLYCLVEPRS